MDKVVIYKKDGSYLCEAYAPEYNGTFMGERTVTLSVKSPTEINFSVGDYIDYRGERFTLYILPELAKTARENTYGGAIEYKNLRFCSVEEELRRCMFLDIVLEDNGLHYTLLPNFSFYCEKPSDLANRIQANLNRQYPGMWTITVNEDVKFVDGVNLSFSSNTCWDALAQVSTNDDIELNFTIDGATRTIVIGGEGEEINFEMKYGIYNGLKSIERTVNTNQAVISRLYAYGNQRNLPYRYYNKRTGEGSDIFVATNSAYIPNLMMPGIHIGWSGADATAFLKNNNMCIITEYNEFGNEILWDDAKHCYYYINDAGERVDTTYASVKFAYYRHYVEIEGKKDSYYCDSSWLESKSAKSEFGILEGVKFFDGSDAKVEDVYPSIENFRSVFEVADALDPSKSQNDKYNFYDNRGNYRTYLGTDNSLDSIAVYLRGENITEDGNIPEQQTASPTFEIIVKNFGFDPNDTELKSGDTPAISMKSGMCVGREFTILSSQKMVQDSSGKWEVATENNMYSGSWGYKLKCEVASDESINQFFPNGKYTIDINDKFVLLGITMPSAYVDVAEKRLLKQAVIYLSENDHTQFNFTPRIDNIFMAEHPEISGMLKEGNVMHVVDANLGIDIKLPISQLKIQNTKDIPEYEVTLSDEQEASLAQRVSAEIKQNFTNVFYGLGGGGGSETSMSTNQIRNSFLSKVREDTAREVINFYKGLSTYEYKGGSGAKLEEAYLQMNRVGSDYTTPFHMSEANVYEFDDRVGRTLELSSSFTFDCYGNKAHATLPVHCFSPFDDIFKQSTLKIIATSRIDEMKTWYYDFAEEKFVKDEREYTVSGRISNDFDIKLLEEQGDVIYDVELSIAYKKNSELEGGLTARLGDDTNQIAVKFENPSIDVKSSISVDTDGLAMTKYDIANQKVISGARLTCSGLQIYEPDLGWRWVHIDYES